MNHIHMDEDEFFDTFEPIKNPYPGSRQGWRDCLHETSGPSYALVQAVLAGGDANIWTLLDVDGRLIIGNGWHYVNRMGYFITANPAQPETTYDICDEEEPTFTNYYLHCGQHWQDEWSAMCNDHCPVCDKEIEPYKSVDEDGETTNHVGDELPAFEQGE